MYAALLLLALGLGLKQERDIPDIRLRNIENTDEILSLRYKSSVPSHTLAGRSEEA